MGCDIHLYVERRNAQGQWEAVKGPNWYLACDKKELQGIIRKIEQLKVEGKEPDAYLLERKQELEQDVSDPKRQTEVLEDWIWSGRSYDLFSMLANVRNYNGIVPMSRPRGLPDDVSPEVRRDYESWDGMAHSASYYTLENLVAFNWNLDVAKSGIVSVEGYKEFKRDGYPSSWHGMLTGSSVIYISNRQMDDLIAGKTISDGSKEYYTKVEWSWTYGEIAGGFYPEVIHKLAELGAPDEIRIVFWFDN